MRVLILLGFLLTTGLAFAQPKGAERICYTPIWPWPRGFWIEAVVDRAPPGAKAGAGSVIWIEFSDAASLRQGASGWCWWLAPRAVVAGKPNARRAIGRAP